MTTQKTKTATRRSSINPDAILKVAPNAKDLEKEVIGKCLMFPAAFDIASEILDPESFYVDSYQRMFRAIVALAAANQPIDIITVANQLARTQELTMVGGAYALTVTTNGVTDYVNITEHCLIVKEYALRRDLITTAGKAITAAYNLSVDVFDLLDQTDKEMVAMTNKLNHKDFKHVSNVVMEVVKDIDKLRNTDMPIIGVPTGFPVLDRITFGWQGTDLVIIAARPSVGKTAFALNLARNAAIDKLKPTPVGYFSLEMGMKQLTQRLLSAESRIHFSSIRSGRISDERYKEFYDKGAARVGEMPIWIDDTPGLSLMQFKSKARRMVNKFGVGLIIIDYLQLMKDGTPGGNKNREQEISTISRTLKEVAKELDIPIVALSQLSREIEKRSTKKPQLSDLRESGAIEQDADSVFALWRPTVEEVQKDPSLDGTGSLLTLKQRNGTMETVHMKFYGEVQLWLPIEFADEYEGKGNWKPHTMDLFSEPIKKTLDDEELPG